jgi:hypothetical protein
MVFHSNKAQNAVSTGLGLGLNRPAALSEEEASNAGSYAGSNAPWHKAFMLRLQQAHQPLHMEQHSPQRCKLAYNTA